MKYQSNTAQLFLCFLLLYYPDCTLRTKQHMHFVHSYMKIVSVWDPTAHFKHLLSKDLFLRTA